MEYDRCSPTSSLLPQKGIVILSPDYIISRNDFEKFFFGNRRHVEDRNNLQYRTYSVDVYHWNFSKEPVFPSLETNFDILLGCDMIIPPSKTKRKICILKRESS